MLTTDILADQARKMREENLAERERKLELQRVRDESARREEQMQRERDLSAQAAVREYLADRSPANREAAISAMERIGQTEADLRRFALTYDEVKRIESTFTPTAIAKLKQAAEKASKDFADEEERFYRPERKLQAARHAMQTAITAASDADRRRREAAARRVKFAELFLDDCPPAADDE